MTFMATFRYGQMDDYFNYNINYENPDIYMDIDPLFGLLILLFKSISLEYTVFVAIISLSCMLLSYRFFCETCKNSCLSLLIFYSYTFMMCPMSSIRQGLCLGLLMYLYPLLINRSKWYYLWVILGSFIHLSFLIALFIPFILKFHFYNKKIVLFSIVGLTVLAFVGLSIATLLPIERITYYEEGEGVSIWLRMILRILIITPVILFKPEENTDGYNAKVICLIGYALYCLFSFNDLVAGRLEYYFRTFMCLFVAYLINNNKRTSRYLSQLGLLLLLHIFLWFKNIDAGIDRMSYKEGITALNFPYISVFNKAELKEYSGIETFGLE